MSRKTRNKDTLWFSATALTPYQGTEPPFYSPEDMPWLETLESAYEEALEELQAYLANQPVDRPYFSTLLGSTGWTTLPLRTWGVNYMQHQRHFPRTLARLKQIEGLVSVSINRLAPGADIPPHFGDTNGAARAHLGLIVPASPPELGLQVNGEVQGWSEGKALAFCDGYIHSAWNHSGGERYILLVDVIRPQFRHRQAAICHAVLASLFLQRLMQYSPAIKFLLFAPLRLSLLAARWAAGPATACYHFFNRRRFRHDDQEK